MAFQMVQSNDRNAKGETQARRYTRADQQGAGQSRTLGEGDPIDILEGPAGLREQLASQGQQAPDVIARSEFRHDSAILRVHGNLRKKGMTQQAAPGVVEGDAGFVAGCLDT